jgi:hypothetical protein
VDKGNTDRVGQELSLAPVAAARQDVERDGLLDHFASLAAAFGHAKRLHPLPPGQAAFGAIAPICLFT